MSRLSNVPQDSPIGVDLERDHLTQPSECRRPRGLKSLGSAFVIILDQRVDFSLRLPHDLPWHVAP